MSFKGNNQNFKNVKKNAREQRLQFMNSQAELIAQKKREIEEKLAAKQQPAPSSSETKAEIVKTLTAPVQQETANQLPHSAADEIKSPIKPLPFRNDGSFLEQFKQLQQQKSASSAASSTSVNSNPVIGIASMKTSNCPPPLMGIDVSVPPPSANHYDNFHHYPPPLNYSSPPPVTSHFTGHSTPVTKIKEEKHSNSQGRSPSPYSPSRPCEDEDELNHVVANPLPVLQPPPLPPSSLNNKGAAGPTFIVKDYHHEPSVSSKSNTSVLMDSGSFSQSSGLDVKRKFKEEPDDQPSETNKAKERERKRQSRWGPEPAVKIEPASPMAPGFPGAGPSTSLLMNNSAIMGQGSILSRITSDPQILTYAVRVFGTTDLTEDQWKQCMDQIKMQYVYQEMLKKKQEREQLAMAGKVRYEYDSDEETEGGTWEHKRRLAEMEKTKDWADKLTEHGRGKHHLSHFLPPEELAKFMDKFKAVQEGRVVDESDYKEFKIAESNVGYQMLKKFGWTEGEGLGIGGSGITAPVNAVRRNEAAGLGVAKPDDLTPDDNEYDAYRKRMMLAYRFRPNPLNNPRRSYY